MIFNSFVSLTLIMLIFICGCGKSKNDTAGESLPDTAGPYLNSGGSNVLAVEVGGGGLCGQNGYANEPCTSVTVCVSGTNQCQTISDILVDTGSVGLRIFSSAVSLALPVRRAPNGNTLAQCAQFGTGNDWGPIVTADVGLGGEPVVTTPIELIDQSFATRSTECKVVETDPKQAGYNGILGIGLFSQDCGKSCAVDSANKMYLSCDSSGKCQSLAVPVGEQLQNPISLLPTDNNGMILAFSNIDQGGSTSARGVLILGIGTQSNNSPQGVKSYLVGADGSFTTQFQGQNYPGSFVDSGSNAIFFPNSLNLPVCSDLGAGSEFYCPSSTVDLTATNLSADGTTTAQVPFSISSADSLFSSGAFAFNDLGGGGTQSFDFGMPFFYGRAVIEGFEEKASSLGTGPLLAY